MATHPENTLPAFRAAVEAGAHMIEFDVWLTRDNHMVVIHDETVDRTTNGSGRVADLSLAAIRQLDAGSWKSDEFTGTSIPTLQEVLDIMPVNIWLNIHLKGDGDLAIRVARLVSETGRLHQAFLACSQSAAKKAKHVVPGILICNMDRKSSTAEYVTTTIDQKANFIQLLKDGEPYTRQQLSQLKRHNIRVNFYKADTIDEVGILLSDGVDFPLVNDIVNFMQKSVEFGINPVSSQK